MKTVRMSRVFASMVGAASLVLMVPVSLSASADRSWDIFWGENLKTDVPAEKVASTTAPGRGFDIFNTGYGVKFDDFEHAYTGTSLGSAASDGWDIYHMGQGDPLR